MITAIIPVTGELKSQKLVLSDVGGRPLIQWTIQAAQHCSYVDRIIVTTSDSDVLDVAQNCGAEALEQSAYPSEGGDYSTQSTIRAVNSLDVVPDKVLMLPATTPFRNSVDIGTVVRYLNSGSTSVVGVEMLGISLDSLRYVTDSRLKCFRDVVNVHKQGFNDALYAVNGAIYGAEWRVLKTEQTFHIDNAAAYFMTPLASINVNVYDRIDIARRLARNLN